MLLKWAAELGLIKARVHVIIARVFCSKEAQAAQPPIVLDSELNRLCLDKECMLKHSSEVQGK